MEYIRKVAVFGVWGSIFRVGTVFKGDAKVLSLERIYREDKTIGEIYIVEVVRSYGVYGYCRGLGLGSVSFVFRVFSLGRDVLRFGVFFLYL